MRHTTNRIRLLLLVLLLAATSAGAWVQLNLRDQGNPDADLELIANNAGCCGGNPSTIASPSITFRREEDGTADVGAMATQTAWLATFSLINGITTSDATATDGGAIEFNEGVASQDLAIDGLNNVYFFTTDDVGAGGLAFASFAFDASGGIADCDILFLDTAASGIVWSTTTPGDPNQDLGPNTFDIQEVMNQEVQHCFGFEHSPVLGVFNGSGHQVGGTFSGDFSEQSSLFPFASGTISGRTFQADDIAAFTALYPSASPNAGTITGSVTFQGGAAVKGGHVVAVSTADPSTPIVGTLSGVDEGMNGTGNFTLSGVPPGTYFVGVEPMIGTTNAFTLPGNTFFDLGDDVTNFASEFWSGAMESDTDVLADDSDAQMITVIDGGAVAGVNIIVNTLAPFATGGANDTFAMARVIGTNTFQEVVDTTAATATDGTDPSTCFDPTPDFTAWYTFTAPSNGTITVSTEGSAYDTGLAAFTGMPGTFVAVPDPTGCDDDISTSGTTFDLTSTITFAATSGTTYGFVVGNVGLDSPPESILVVNFTFTPLAGAAPVAVNDSYTTGPNQQLVIDDGCPGASTFDDLLCNDTDADLDPLSVVTGTVTSPANGSVMANADGSFTYTPNLGFSGMDTFTYQVTDGVNNSNFATVTITVNQCTRDFDNDGADNQFENTQNWDPDGPPDFPANAVPCIGGAFAVTHSTGVETIFSLRHTSTMPLTFTGGTLTMDGSSQIGAGGLVLTSGALDVAAAATLTINGPVTWDAGTMAGSGGVFVFAGGGTLSTAGNKTINAAQVTNPNGQTLTWSDGNIRLNNGSIFTNAGILNANNNDTFEATSGSGTFVNTGSLNKVGGGGFTRTTNAVTFISSGFVDVDADEFNLGGPGTITGPVNVAIMGATFSMGGFGGATVNFNSGGSVTGAGEFTVGQGTANFNNGAFLSTAVRMDAATLNLTTGSTTSIPSMLWIGAGTVNANNALTIGAGGLDWGCGTFGGTQTVTLNGPGTLGAGCAGDKTFAGGNFINNGQVMTWTSGNIQFNNATAQLTNSGTFAIQTDADITNGGAGGAIVNTVTGNVTKSVAVGTTDVGVPLLNDGGLNVNTGTLNFLTGFTQQTNGLTTLNGATLASAGLLTFDGGVLRGAGPGMITGNVDINNTAVLVPGINAPGVLNQTGILNINTGGSFTVDLGGTTPGTGAGFHDQHNVTGTANIAANTTLNVGLTSFTPMLGDTFTILTATTARNGQFTTLNLPSVAPNSFQVNYLANSVQLEVVPNAAPNAVDDNAMTLEDTFVDINVLANDTDTDGPNPLSIDSFTQPANGTVTDQTGGILRYTPDLNENNVTMAGTDTFTYTVTDGSGINFVMANVNVDVTPVNDAPVFSLDVVGAGGPEDGFSSVNGVTSGMAPGPVTATDEAGQNLTFIVMSDNPGLFAAGPSIDTTTGDMTFTLAQDANGTANLTITLMDDGGTANGGDDSTTAPQMFLFEVFPVNDAPVAAADGPFTVVQNSMNNALDVLANDTDVDLDTLMVTQITVAATNGTATANGTNVLYTPNMGFTGMDTFTYEACDPSAACDTAVVTVNVVANFPPVAGDDMATTNEDTPVIINVLANDNDGGDGGPLSVTMVTAPANGMAVINMDNTVTYTPNANFNGMDSFTYTLSDTFSTDTGTVNVTVVAVNDAPTFTQSCTTVNDVEDVGAVTVPACMQNMSPGPADEAAQTLNFVVMNDNPALFSVQPAVSATTGDLTFTTAPNANGTANLTVSLMDNGGTANGGDDTSSSVMVQINIAAVNDPPVITAGPTSNPVSPIPGNTATGANVAFSITVSDPDGDPLTFSWTGGCGASSVEDPTLACPFGMGLSVDVTVSDPSMATDTGNIVVDVTDYSIAANCTTGMPPCNSATMATIAAGQAVDFSLTATGINGTYAANITYSCMNLPAFTTCTFTPSASVASAPPGGVVTMLRIQTTAPGFAQLHAPASQQSQPPSLALFLTVPGLALFGLVLAGGRRKRRSLGTLCLLAIVLVMATVLVGCGSGGDFFTSLGSSGTPVGSHSITINATGSGTLQHSANLTVVVQ